MGWFSKTKTYVGASTSRLISEEPDNNKDTVLLSVRNSKNIPEQLLDAQLNSLGTKSRAFYRYAQNHYVEGLPNGTMENVGQRAANVDLVLRQLLGEPVLVQSVVYDLPDPEVLSERHLQDVRERNRDTESIGIPPTEINAVGAVLYVDTVFTNNFTTLDIKYSYTDSNTGLEATYLEEISSPVPIRTTEMLYVATYYLKDAALQPTGDLQYWYYYPSDNLHPVIDQFTAKTEVSAYFPIIPIRENNVNFTAESRKETDLYKTSKTLLNKLNTSLVDVGEAVHANPDIDDVDHTYIVMSVPLNTDRSDSIKYLHAYFKHLRLSSTSTKQDFEYWEANLDTIIPPRSVVSISDRRLRLDFSYNYIHLQEVEGVIGAIGEANKDIVIKPRGSFGWGSRYERSELILRRQVTSTHYEEITISGLHHINYVYGSYTVETTLTEALGDDFNNFIIPVHFHVLQSMKLNERSAVIYDAYRLVFNSVQTVKLKWYQTGFFKAILIIVAVIVAVYTGYDIYTVITSAASIGAAITAVVIKLAINYVVGAVITFVAEQFGGVAALLLIIAAYAYSTKSSGNTAAVEGLPFSEEMLTAVRLSFSAYDTVIDTKLKEIYAESQELARIQEELIEDLDEKQKELEFGLANPLLLVREPVDTISIDESPDRYYNRLIHSGNVGVLALDAITHYASNQLTLPKLPESVLNLSRHL